MKEITNKDIYQLSVETSRKMIDYTKFHAKRADFYIADMVRCFELYVKDLETNINTFSDSNINLRNEIIGFKEQIESLSRQIETKDKLIDDLFLQSSELDKKLKEVTIKLEDATPEIPEDIKKYSLKQPKVTLQDILQDIRKNKFEGNYVGEKVAPKLAIVLSNSGILTIDDLKKYTTEQLLDIPLYGLKFHVALMSALKFYNIKLFGEN